MSQPDPYVREFSFAGFQSAHPATPLPGDKADAEFDAVQAVIDEVLERIAILQRDDLELANKSVGYDQLKDEISLSFEPPSVWTTATGYVERDMVFQTTKFYRCLVAHTSDVFATDLADGKWELIADFTHIVSDAEAAADAAVAAKVASEAARDIAIANSVGASNSAAAALLSENNAAASLASAEAAALAAAVSQAAAAASAMTAAASASASQIAQTAAEAAQAAAEAAAASIVIGPGGVQAYSANLDGWAVIDPDTFVLDEDDMLSDSSTNPPSQRSTKAYVDGRVLDEDNMASDSATRPPSQQSVKAYVDAGPASSALQEVMRDRLDVAPYVATRAALKALDTTKDQAACLTEAGRDGAFAWRAGDYSTQITADPLEGVYIKADAIAATAGAWVRVFEGAVNIEWFGAVGDVVTDDTAAIEAAISLAGIGGAVYFPNKTFIFSDTNSDGFGLIQLSGQTWYGEGAASILRLAAATTTINVAVVAADFAIDVTIRDMQIDGNRGNITPASDLYNTFNLVRGPRGGKRMKWQNLILSNSWGRSLQTSNESATEYARDAVIDNVSVINGGTKGISVTKTKKATVSNCFSEINPYTAADHPGGVGDGNAASGSCFEMNKTSDVTWTGNHGIQVGSVVIAPGFRIVNGNYNIKITGNTIEAASYMLFAQNCDDVDFFGNAARSIRGNGILIADADGEAAGDTCRRVRVHHNTVFDCTGAFVTITANKSSANPFVECYIYDNDFIDDAGVATHGIYNNGVIAPAVGGTCLVYAWDNNIVGTGVAANPFAGPAAHEIQDTPNKRWRILAQSSAPVSLTGTTTETTMATISVPKDRLGKNGMLRITATYSYPNNANNKITRVRFGGLQSYAATNTTTLQQRFQVEIGNRNSLTSQFTALAGAPIGFGTSASAPVTMAIDTSVDQNVTLTGQLGNAADTMVLESYTVELCYGL